MKKILSMCLVLFMFFGITGCDLEESHEGQVKTPSASSVQEGRDYQDVYDDFVEEGFTHIRLEVLDDLIFGWLTKEGEVESVSVDGDTDYSADEWYPADVEVIITYHTFPNTESEDNEETTTVSSSKTSEESNDDILTVDNCQQLAKMLVINADRDAAYTKFANEYYGKTIEFDGSIDYIENCSYYNSFKGTTFVSKTEYDVLVSYGDYNAERQIGPTIKIENVSSKKLGYDVSKSLPDFMTVGSNVKIQVRVGDYNEDTGIFTMHLESIVSR